MDSIQILILAAISHMIIYITAENQHITSFILEQGLLLRTMDINVGLKLRRERTEFF